MTGKPGWHSFFSPYAGEGGLLGGDITSQSLDNHHARPKWRGMSENHITINMRDAHSGHAELTRLWRWLKPKLRDGLQFRIDAKPATRSDGANRLLHATIGEIAAQIEWAGSKREIEVWKRLLVAAWLRAKGEALEILPAIDGNGVDIVFQRTSKLTRAECADLQEFVYAWGVQAGVKFPAPDYAD